jgi:hypothetical protein
MDENSFPVPVEKGYKEALSCLSCRITTFPYWCDGSTYLLASVDWMMINDIHNRLNCIF